MRALKNLLAIILLPGVVTVVGPWLVLRGLGNPPPGWGLPDPWWVLPILLGSTLILLGLFFLTATVDLFIRWGRGTLAPWEPPRSLVVQGPYRYVRNPMISGVFAIVLGEAILFGTMPLFLYFVCVVLVNCVYIPLLEEPGLERRFGESYRIYKQNVPRWIPRLTPWEGE